VCEPREIIHLPAHFIAKYLLHHTEKWQIAAILPAVGTQTARACQRRHPLWSGQEGVHMFRWTTERINFFSYGTICKRLVQSNL
jgi:hypothetical protein